MMASVHGLRDLYPITAGLTVIGYQDGSSDPTGNILLSVASILFILAVTFIIVFVAKNREVTAAKKKKKNTKKWFTKEMQLFAPTSVGTKPTYQNRSLRNCQRFPYAFQYKETPYLLQYFISTIPKL